MTAEVLVFYNNRLIIGVKKNKEVRYLW